MTARKGRWLDTALRAQQARTLGHQDRVHTTQAAHALATQQEAGARQDLHALAAAWRQGRDAAQLTHGLDGLFRRFHAQLHAEATSATHARIEHQQALDAALAHLRQSHAIQQALDKTVERRDRRVVKDAQAKERSMATESWMLAQAGKKGSE